MKQSQSTHSSCLVELRSSQRRVGPANCGKCGAEKALVAPNVEPRERMALGSREGPAGEMPKGGLKMGEG